jgi:predicted CXXCH cytochrome family protein
MKSINQIMFSMLFFISITSVTGVSQPNFSDCTKSGCHMIQTKLSVVHAPLEDGCAGCHESITEKHPKTDQTDFKLTEKMPDLCYQCHEMDIVNMVVHNPVAEGKCTACHNPHSSDSEKLLVSEGSEMCFKCHETHPEENFIHGPVAGGMCAACHDPHTSTHKKLLIRDGQEVCLFCHTAKKEIQTKASVHQPFLEGCMDCHTPHNSEAKYLLSTDVPQLCYQCHNTVEVGLGKKSEVHGPFQEGGKCYLCHNAHVSDNPPLLQDSEQKLCFTCHNQRIVKGERKLKDIEKCVNSKYVHEPVANNGCSVCHAAHTPDNYFLLSAAYPSGSYTEGKKENFEHCFDCHDPALMENAETSEATNFRDGTNNLHFVHVNREKARNCTTCHDIHGSKYAHLIAEKVPFGKWEMPMKYEVTENGGSCFTGCHKKLNYSRTIN